MPKKMCDKAVDSFVPVLKFVHDYFVKCKMTQNLYNTLFASDDVTFINEDSHYIKVFGGEMGILSVDLDDASYSKDNPGTIIHDRILACCN